MMKTNILNIFKNKNFIHFFLHIFFKANGIVQKLHNKESIRI